MWNLTVGEVLEATARRFPDKTMIIYTGGGGDDVAAKRMTFREVNEHTNQVAHFFESRSYGKGDVIALCAENRHDYMSLWLGMSKLGSVTALINTYIRDSSLVHTLETVKAKGVMFTSETEKSTSTFYRFHSVLFCIIRRVRYPYPTLGQTYSETMLLLFDFRHRGNNGPTTG